MGWETIKDTSIEHVLMFTVLPTLPQNQSRPQIHEQKKIESLERINTIRKTNGILDSCNPCKRLDLMLN